MVEHVYTEDFQNDLPRFAALQGQVSAAVHVHLVFMQDNAKSHSGNAMASSIAKS